MRKAVLAISILAVLVFMAGCGSQSSMAPSTNNPAVQTAPVGVTVTDDPPQGVTVLFFQLSITGATLTNSTGGSVSLLSSTNPIPVNVSELLTDDAFLGNQNVTAGTYTGLSLTFANPQLTIFNASDTTISSMCAVGKVCQVTPSTSGPLTLNFSSAPFPVTLSASSPLEFKLDIHMNTVIQSDLSLNLGATDGITLSEVSPSKSGEPIPHMGKLRGTIQSTGTNQFMLQTLEGRNFTINVNSGTTYSNFPSSATCTTSAEAFSCLATGQVVKVEVTLQTDGTLLATEVNYIQLPSQQTAEGTIIGLNTSGGTTTMDLVIEHHRSDADEAVLPLGRHARVTVPATGVTYAIDAGTFMLPSGLTFASISDLQVGQKVLVVVQGTVTPAASSGMSGSGMSNSGGSGMGGWDSHDPFGSPDVTFTASSITLEASQIIGTVAGVNASALSFTLATKPVFFVPWSSTAGAMPPWAPVIITIQTTSATTFTNFTTNSISGLAVNDVVSIHGWVFSTPKASPTVTVAADKVVDRPGPTPLF